MDDFIFQFPDSYYNSVSSSDFDSVSVGDLFNDQMFFSSVSSNETAFLSLEDSDLLLEKIDTLINLVSCIFVVIFFVWLVNSIKHIARRFH